MRFKTSKNDQNYILLNHITNSCMKLLPFWLYGNVEQNVVSNDSFKNAKVRYIFESAFFVIKYILSFSFLSNICHFVQNFIKRAINIHCSLVIVEMLCNGYLSIAKTICGSELQNSIRYLHFCSGTLNFYSWEPIFFSIETFYCNRCNFRKV